MSQMQPARRLFYVTLEFKNGITRSVPVKAVSLDVAERRALKRNPAALGVKRETR